jgi:hypothetical protein
VKIDNFISFLKKLIGMAMHWVEHVTTTLVAGVAAYGFCELVGLAEPYISAAGWVGRHSGYAGLGAGALTFLYGMRGTIDREHQRDIRIQRYHNQLAEAQGQHPQAAAHQAQGPPQQGHHP